MGEMWITWTPLHASSEKDRYRILHMRTLKFILYSKKKFEALEIGWKVSETFVPIKKGGTTLALEGRNSQTAWS